MWTGDALLKGLAAVVCLGFVIAIRGGQSSPNASRRYLRAFLVLIAGNQLLEMLRALQGGGDATVLYTRLAGVCAALDPWAFFLFGAALNPRSKMGSTPFVVLVGGISAALALAIGWGGVNPRLDAIYILTLRVFTLTVYGVVLVSAVLRLGEDDMPWRWVASASMIATLPLIPQTVDGVLALYGRVTGPLANPPLQLLLYGVALATASTALWLIMQGRGERARRTFGWSLGGTLLLVLLLQFYRIHQSLVIAGFGEHIATFRLAGMVGAPVRWLAFGGLMSIGFLRSDEFGLDLGARRAAARIFLGLSFLAVVASAGVVIVSIPAATAWGFQPFAAVLLVSVLAFSTSFRALVDRIAARVYRVPLPGDALARQAAYRSAVAGVMKQGASVDATPELVRFRRELDIDEATARVIELSVESTMPAGLRSGHRLRGRFRVLRLIGKGGGGSAFLAHDELMRREVVLKEVPHDDGGEAALREARTAGAVRSERVVAVHDVLPRSTSSILVEEHVDGGTLQERIAARTPVSEREAFRILEDVLEGLQDVHEAGVVHGDIKPANIFLTKEGRAKIGDFGIARARQGHTVRFGLMSILRGTPGALAPEQLRGEATSQASDLYTCALLARALFPEGPPAPLEPVLARALRDQPDDRWPSAAEMLDAVRAARRASAFREVPVVDVQQARADDAHLSKLR